MLVQVKKHHICQKDYIWNPTCSYENGNYLASITDDSVIACDETIEETKTIPINFKKTSSLSNKKFLYFTYLFNGYHCIIDSCLYLLLSDKIWSKIKNIYYHFTQQITNTRQENHTYYFYDDIMDTKNFDLNNIKTDEKSYKNFPIYYIGYMTIKGLKYLKIISINPLYLIINNVMGFFEEINKNKYVTLIPTNESKEIIKKYEELWSKIIDLISSTTKKSGSYDEKHENQI